MSTSTGRAVGWLSFLRIIDIPFETCVAALENWQRTEQDSELRIGPSLLRGPLKHDRDSGTCRIEVRLARGPLRPALRMRLNIDRWSWPPARTALELIPCDRVRPTAAYFRSGHLLLDSLTDSVPWHTPAQRLDHIPESWPTAPQGLPGPTGQSPRPMVRRPGSTPRATGQLHSPACRTKSLWGGSGPDPGIRHGGEGRGFGRSSGLAAGAVLDRHPRARFRCNLRRLRAVQASSHSLSHAV